MSDLFGSNGAQLLSWQLDMYRWQDTTDRIRAQQQAMANDLYLDQRYNVLVDQYNELLEDHTKLRAWAAQMKSYEEKRDAFIRDLEAQQQRDKEEIRDVKDSLESEKSEVMLLRRQISRMKSPEG